MIILSVDYGDVRTGLAVCDKNEMLASPVCVIKQENAEMLCKEIAAHCQRLKVECIVCGLPKNMDGSEGFRATACREFAALLQETTGLPIEMLDERLTTVSAHNYLNVTNTRGKKRKETVDAVAATLILEDYLTLRKNRR
ncbi:MAG: Holliday junction resolvase RuvX [Clostridia bacterium]|nr:Holliday junction resolvase RuvX [Clostridia bacterium]